MVKGWSHSFGKVIMQCECILLSLLHVLHFVKYTNGIKIKKQCLILVVRFHIKN